MKNGLITTKGVILKIIDREEEVYSQKISRDTGINYGHVTNIVKELKASELVVSRSEGRKNFLDTTDQGHRIAVSIWEVEKFAEEHPIEDKSLVNPNIY